jgi:gliding motility-associated-like protein
VGCLDTAYLNLEVESQEFVFFPNAFTPNDDQKNDRYLISYLGIRNFHIAIYDRWGQLMYESSDINEGWDGTTKGEACTADVYVYAATYTNKKGLPRSKSGNITLLR